MLGVNGAGTTTISMLCGLTKPTSGNAYLLGESMLTDAKRIKPQINLSPQETAVAPNLNVTENLGLIAGIYGQSAQQAKASTQQALDEFGLTAVATQKAQTLSGWHATPAQHRNGPRHQSEDPVPRRADGGTGCIRPS